MIALGEMHIKQIFNVFYW